MKFNSKKLAFLFLFLAFLSITYQSGTFNFRVLIPSIALILNFVIAFKRLFFSKVQKFDVGFQLIIVSLILISCPFPFQIANPYSVFTFIFFRTILLCLLSLLLLYIQVRDDLDIKISYWIGLGSLVAFNGYFVLFDYRAISPDDISRHTGNAFYLFDLITSSESSKLFSTLTYYDFYQPLMYLISLPFIAVFGKSYTAANMSLVLFWLPVGFYFLYAFLTNFVRVDKYLAIIICFCIFGSVICASMIKQFMMDFPCLVMVIVYNYFLAKSFYLKYNKASFIAGIFFGLSLLTKANFLLLGLAPLFIAIIRMAVQEKKKKFKNSPQRLISLALHCIGIFIGGGFWYLINRNHFAFQLPTVTTWFGQYENDPYPYSLASAVYYLRKFVYYFSVPIFLFVFIGMAFALKNFKKKFYYNLITFSSLVLVYIASTITWNKDTRTLLPSIFLFIPGFIGILTANPFRKVHFAIVSILVSLVFFYNMNIGVGLGIEPKKIGMTDPYMIPLAPIPPTENDFNQAHYTYVKLFKENYTDSFPPNLNISISPSIFSDRYYGSIFGISDKDPKQALGANKVFFFRDYFWRDYYLYEVSADSVYIKIRKAASQVIIGGDMQIIIHQVNKQGTRFSQEWKFTNDQVMIPKQDSIVQVSMNMVMRHSSPSGEYIQFIYDIIGKPYDRFMAKMICYSLGLDQTDVEIFKR